MYIAAEALESTQTLNNLRLSGKVNVPVSGVTVFTANTLLGITPNAVPPTPAQVPAWQMEARLTLAGGPAAILKDVTGFVHGVVVQPFCAESLFLQITANVPAGQYVMELDVTAAPSPTMSLELQVLELEGFEQLYAVVQTPEPVRLLEFSPAFEAGSVIVVPSHDSRDSLLSVSLSQAVTIQTVGATAPFLVALFCELVDREMGFGTVVPVLPEETTRVLQLQFVVKQRAGVPLRLSFLFVTDSNGSTSVTPQGESSLQVVRQPVMSAPRPGC